MPKTNSDVSDIYNAFFGKKSSKDLLQEYLNYLAEKEQTEKNIANVFNFLYKRFFNSVNKVLEKNNIENREQILKEIQTEFLNPFKLN